MLSRRRFLVRTGQAGVGVAALGAVGFGGHAVADTAVRTVTPSGDVHVFRSRPDLSPPRLQATGSATDPEPGLFLLTPNLGPSQQGAGQQGLMLADTRGEVVWFEPLGGSFSNLRAQVYRGRPVLTWWQGAFDVAGFGRGQNVIVDGSYRQVATVSAGNGLQADLHEFVVTPDDTALLTAYRETRADLRPLGGPASDAVYDSVVQEVDIATGAVLFEWHSLDHVGIEESYATYEKGGVLDYFHVNSIARDPADGNLVVSARNTWAVYKIERSSGRVLWRLGGKASDFAMAPGTQFAWQHDARPQSDGTITLFDDGAAPAVHSQSRGLRLVLDETRMRARVGREYLHPARLLAESQGSVQVRDDGTVVIGWGAEPYASQFTADGTLELDLRMPSNEESYRAFRQSWVGRPTTTPAIATQVDDGGGYSVFASWNGATEVASWQALSGRSPAALLPVATARRSGFETAMTVHPSGPLLAVAALDADGRTLGTSAVVPLSPPPATAA